LEPRPSENACRAQAPQAPHLLSHRRPATLHYENAMPFLPNQRVRLNLAGMMIEGVTFHAAVTDALATVIRKTADDPPAYLVDLLFSFKGLKQIDVPEERMRPA
jgi:hypothetical protein